MIPRTPTADVAEITSSPTFTSATKMFRANGRTAKAVSPVIVETHGANQKIALSASVGMMSSLSSSLRASAMGYTNPCGPTRMGPRRTWKSASSLRSTSTMYPATRGKSPMMTSVVNTGANNGCERTVCILSLPQQRSLRQPQERLGVDADGERQHTAYAQRQPQHETRRHGGLLRLLANEHAAHNLEVVIDSHRHVQRGHHRQRVMPGLNQRQKDVDRK